MSRLWTFGDSFTAGNGCLPTENYIKYKISNEDLVWPEIIANVLNLELINIGMGAYSNDKIIDSIIEKYNLIKEIRESYSIEEFFKAKINNYSEYAAIYNLIEAHNSTEFIEPNQIIDNKVTLLEHITRKEINKDGVKDRILEEYAGMDKGTRLIAYRVLLERFNKKYSTLDTRQRNVLKEYINNISNTTVLKEFVNNQYSALRNELAELSNNVTDKTIQIKLTEVINLLQPLGKTQNVKDENLISLLQYYQLANELKTVK
jgi:hypothetical protein